MSNIVRHCTESVDYLLYKHGGCFISCVEIVMELVVAVTRIIKIMSDNQTFGSVIISAFNIYL